MMEFKASDLETYAGKEMAFILHKTNYGHVVGRKDHRDYPVALQKLMEFFERSRLRGKKEYPNSLPELSEWIKKQNLYKLAEILNASGTYGEFKELAREEIPKVNPRALLVGYQEKGYGMGGFQWKYNFELPPKKNIGKRGSYSKQTRDVKITKPEAPAEEKKDVLYYLSEKVTQEMADNKKAIQELDSSMVDLLDMIKEMKCMLVDHVHTRDGVKLMVAIKRELK